MSHQNRGRKDSTRPRGRTVSLPGMDTRADTTGVSRGASTQVGFILAVVIATVITAGLITAASTIVEDKQQQVEKAEMMIVGERVTAALMEMDTLSEKYSAGSVTATVPLPEDVSGSTYIISFSSGPGPTDDYVLVRSMDGTTVRVPMNIESTVQTENVVGGTLKVTYSGGTGITITET